MQMTSLGACMARMGSTVMGMGREIIPRLAWI